MSAIDVLALHQVEGHLPYGLVCLCGKELVDLDPIVMAGQVISGRARALAAHQVEALATAGYRIAQSPGETERLQQVRGRLDRAVKKLADWASVDWADLIEEHKLLEEGDLL